MEKAKACMVTGHRTFDPCKAGEIRRALYEEVVRAVEEGYTHFISGFADGVDLLFAEIVAELKAIHPIRLEAAIPYRNRLHTPNKQFQSLIRCCDVVGVHAESYAPSCFHNRNRFMVQHAQRVIAVYDGRETGGTLATMRYAHALEKEVRVISIR